MASGKSLAVRMQEIASNAQIEVQRLANEATQKSFDYNAREAATNRDWEKMMSDTSHQREVADLKKAGLNPVLAANNGAQSYVSSSASADAKDASSAVANLAAQRMGSEAQGYAADRSAAATRYAAKTTAAATRAAAAAQASAARYAAAMQYENNRQHEAWQMNYMKEEYKQKIELVGKTPVSSIGGVLDKFAVKSGLYDLVGTKGVKSVISSMRSFLNNDHKYFISKTGKVNANNFVLSKAGKAFINMQLSRFGLEVNNKNRLAFVKAFAFNSARWQKWLIAKVPKKTNSAVMHRYTGITIR